MYVTVTGKSRGEDPIAQKFIQKHKQKKLKIIQTSNRNKIQRYKNSKTTTNNRLLKHRGKNIPGNKGQV